MPEFVPAFRTSDGKVHTSFLEALKHELVVWLKDAGDNDVGAKKIVETLNPENIGEITDMFAAIREEMAKPKQFEVRENKTEVVA